MATVKRATGRPRVTPEQVAAQARKLTARQVKAIAEGRDLAKAHGTETAALAARAEALEWIVSDGYSAAGAGMSYEEDAEGQAEAAAVLGCAATSEALWVAFHCAGDEERDAAARAAASAAGVELEHLREMLA